MGNVNILDVLAYTINDGGSQYRTVEDVWFFDYHLTKPHASSTSVVFVPQYALDQIDPEFEEINTSGVVENMFSPSNSFFVTSDYLKGTFLFSKTTKNLLYLDIPEKSVETLPKVGTFPNTLSNDSFLGKCMEYRSSSNWVLFANVGDETLYKYDVSGSQWSSLQLFPTGWQANSTPSRDICLLIDQATNDLYMMTRNTFVISIAQKTIYYNYRLFKFDFVGNLWVEVLPDGSQLNLYQYGYNNAAGETLNSPGRCMIHNGKLYVFNIFTEAFPNNTKGRTTYLSHIVINIATKGVEKNDWTPIYFQNINCTLPVQAVRYGTYMALISPDCPNSSVLINPTNNKINYLRLSLGTAQGSNTVRTSSIYALSSVPSSQQIYDPRERKTYPTQWSQGTLIADYSFEDQIYTQAIEINCTTDTGINIYVDLGTGTFSAANVVWNAQSQLLTATLNSYLKAFRISYTIGSGNALSELYKIRVLANNTYVKIRNAGDTAFISDDTFTNIVLGTPTASRLYKVVNQTGARTTAVRVYLEADGDTGSYFTELSSQSDSGFIRHCTANSGTACTKGFSFGTSDCANGRCGGYEKAVLLPIPQSLPPGSSAPFYVRVNVPVNQTRINRQAKIIAQLEY